MRNRETEDGMRQELSFTLDMSLEEMMYHFQQETQRTIKSWRMEGMNWHL